MPKKIIKGAKKSKRITTHTRSVIQKRVKQHKRKTKKEANKLQKAGFGSKSKKSNQNSDLPNLMPLKKKIVRNLLAQKSTVARNAKLATLTNKTAALTNMTVIKDDPKVREENFLAKAKANDTNKTLGHVKKNYMKELKEVVESSDIILEVLDARDPEGCRCREMEAEI